MANASERATDSLTGAEAAVEMLKAHGVEILFGLCGDTSLPFYDALARLPHGMRHILARDERSAAYMADGYARASGKVGVCEGAERRRRHLYFAGARRSQRIIRAAAVHQ